MNLDLFFLGTAGSTPTAHRGLPGTLIRRGGDRVLVDCGEGTQRQLVRSTGLVELDEILITHFHADHVLGLPGLLKTYGLLGRERSLAVYGPRGLGRLFSGLTPVIGRTPFEVELHELESGDELRREGYRLAAFAVEHRVRALGYALLEDERPGRFDPAQARALGLASGPDFGRLQNGETVGDVTPDQVLGEARRGRRVVLTGDTVPCDLTRAVAHGADLLVHEATFTEAEADRAVDTAHSTARGAAELAAEAGVEMLALTHLSSRHPAGIVCNEARTVFANTAVPRDFDRVELPFPERGAPNLIRGDR